MSEPKVTVTIKFHGPRAKSFCTISGPGKRQRLSLSEARIFSYRARLINDAEVVRMRNQIIFRLAQRAAEEAA